MWEYSCCVLSDPIRTHAGGGEEKAGGGPARGGKYRQTRMLGSEVAGQTGQLRLPEESEHDEETGPQHPGREDQQHVGTHLFDAVALLNPDTGVFVTADVCSFQPFVIYDVDTLWKAESGLVWSQLLPGAPLTKEIGVHVFYRCQCTTVETVRELTEFAKCIPGFVDLFLNDQVRPGLLNPPQMCHPCYTCFCPRRR